MTLDVFLHDKHIGTLDRGRRPHLVDFTVDSDLSTDVTITSGATIFPGTKITGEHISNFFGGYTSEGLTRERMADMKRIRRDDLYGLLAGWGLTVGGALSFRTDDPHDAAAGEYRELTRAELRRKVKEAAERYDLGNEPDSGRSAVPGFQPKLLLAKIDGRWLQPMYRAHSTHIIKPQLARRPHLIVDEFYSHELTRVMGLSSFASELITLNGTTFLAIERYDRLVDNHDGTVRALHQEDAAQVLGLDWVDSRAKFQDPALPHLAGRPTAASIAEIFGTLGDGSDANRWLQYLTYSVLVGNHDGHAKNVSVIHDAAGDRIADLYDAVPILQINDVPRGRGARVEDELALSINGSFHHNDISRRDLAEEAESWGFASPKRVATLIDETIDAFANAVDAAAPPEGASPGLRDRLRYNLDQLASGKKIGRPRISGGSLRFTPRGKLIDGHYAVTDRPE